MSYPVLLLQFSYHASCVHEVDQPESHANEQGQPKLVTAMAANVASGAEQIRPHGESIPEKQFVYLEEPRPTHAM